MNKTIEYQGGKIFRTLMVSVTLIIASFVSINIAKASQSEGENYQGYDWTLMNLENQPVRLSSFEGQPVLLVFWATWCPYCKKLLPGIQKLHDKYHPKGLKIIAVNIREDWKPRVYWRNYGYTFEAVLEGDDIGEIYGISGTPGLVFIDPQGQVMSVQSFSDPEHPILEKFAAYYTAESSEAVQAKSHE